MQEIIVSANEAGQRFDKLLAKYLNEAPKSFIYKMLRKKNIVLNGKKATGNEKLAVGDSVKLFLADETIEKFSKISIAHTNKKLDILYEDEHVLLINKPVGMLSQKAEAKDESLVEHIISYMLESGELTEAELRKFKPSICNRLDRNTSGLIVAGKSLVGLQVMGELFKERSIKKYYRCLVSGKVSEKQYIKGYLKKDEATNKVTVSQNEVPDSLPIETEYEPIWANDFCTLLEVHLITGRTHQIRAHLASQKHPIIGDYKYGNRRINDSFKEKYKLQSQLLHAYRLEMPELAGELENLSNKQFVAPLPSLFEKIANAEKR
ncbi:MAG: RluA family pseudouridine synthase [Tyzzerella sp.]|nr:RluA family pseudouridine synthase [Tyzzerella sp.]